MTNAQQIVEMLMDCPKTEYEKVADMFACPHADGEEICTRHPRECPGCIAEWLMEECE